MITSKTEWNEYLSNMCGHASDEFRQSDLYYALKEKIDRMESDCKFNFNKTDYAYIEAWMESIMSLDSALTYFVHAQAYKDCITLLKRMGVL